jgi:hypothetical protein
MAKDEAKRAAQYILKAEWCALQAQAAASTAQRDAYLRMEKGWRELAQGLLEQSDR